MSILLEFLQNCSDIDSGCEMIYSSVDNVMIRRCH